MNDLPNMVSRYVAPFGLGMSMAAVAAANDLLTGAAMAALAYLFALLSAGAGRRMLVRVLAVMPDPRGVWRLAPGEPALDRGAP